MTLIIILVVVVLAVVTPQGRTAVRTALFVPQVLPSIPAKPQEWFVDDPIWRQVSYPQADGQGIADLILPVDADTNSAVLFFLGVVVNRPREDSRVVALAEGLARSGMVVMIPWSDTQLQQRIVPNDIDDLVSGFQYLRSLEEVDPENVGMGGICTGASMSLIAAQDERIRDDVKFINFISGYYDAYDFVKAIASRSRFYGDYVVPWQTDQLAYRVFRNHLLDGVTDLEERDFLKNVFEDDVPTIDTDVSGLSSEAQAVYMLLAGTPYSEVDGLMEKLSPKTKQFLREISPSTDIEKTRARVLIMHDRADKLVPSEESRRLADALSAAPNTYHTEFSFFQKEIQLHIADAPRVTPLDFVHEAFKLYLHMYNIMRDIS
ncbi:hypothetical protein M1O55_01535 [Dehalococcoidia bacterium]|nr:hypothetical protein [Dehalococcoidia bacterium]